MFCRIFSVLRDTFEFSWILPDVILFSSQSIVNLIISVTSYQREI